MSSPSASATPGQPHVWRNFICHCFEGGLYMGGVAFLAPETVMPSMAKSLGGQAWVVAMMPVLLPAAFALAGLFIAPVVERLHHFKPWVMTIGICQRLPYLITGLILLFAGHIDDALLPIVVLTPVISGTIGGFGVVAWMEMVTRMIPERTRASGWAVRYIIQACIGMAAGTVIHHVLTHYPGRQGYAYLHLTTFGFLMLSWLSQFFMIESEDIRPKPRESRESYSSYLKSLPKFLSGHPELIRFIAVRFTGLGYLMIAAFLTLHALQLTGRPEADEGRFVTMQNIGTIVGSSLAAWLGYRSGGRLALIVSRVFCVIVCFWASWSETFPSFLAVYAVLGCGLFLDRVGDLTLAAELCPPERRSTLQAVLTFCNAGSLLLAVAISGQIYTYTQSFQYVAATAAAFAMISIFILRTIPEPRGRRRSQ
ncbi:MAG: MFS transporter [Verrucomicrobiaceae bacterium]|nr:MFS transporter [Verrucomicrobiaceae bacterium]